MIFPAWIRIPQAIIERGRLLVVSKTCNPGGSSQVSPGGSA
jgi:hypothetical protein